MPNWISKFYEAWRRVVWRVAKEAALPACAALVWGVVAGINKHSIIDGISAGGIAFFLILAIQGQILRVAKNVRDEDDANEFKNSFTSIQQALDELSGKEWSSQYRKTVVTFDDGNPPREINSEKLTSQIRFEEAERAIQNEELFAGVLLSAIAFELSIRETAVQLGLDYRRPLNTLVDEITKSRLPSSEIDEIRTLVRMRNSLVHAEVKNDFDIGQALNLFVSFVRSAKLIKDAAAGVAKGLPSSPK